MKLGLGLSIPGVATMGVVRSAAEVIASAAVWLDASDTATITDAGAGAVSQWADKNNGYLFTQGNSSSRPTTGVTSQNSLNTVAFDGADFLVSTAAAATWRWMHDGETWTGFVVARYTAATLGAFFGTVNGSSTLNGTFVSFDNRTGSSITARFDSYSSNGTANVARSTGSDNQLPANQHNVLVVSWDPDNATLANRVSTRVNGASLGVPNTASASVNADDPSSTLTIGARGAGSSSRTTGDIAEIVLVRGALKPAEIVNVEAALKAKWATP